MRAATKARMMTERMIRTMAGAGPGGKAFFQLAWSGGRRCAGTRMETEPPMPTMMPTA
jgi:hypothetical protein